MHLIDFPQGITFHKRSTESKFYKDMKRIFEFSNIPYVDPCCIEDLAYGSVRGVLADGTLEIFDGTEWVAVTNLSPVYLSNAQNDIAAGTGGAIPITNYLTTINTDAGGDAFTLADGSTQNQMKKILLVVDGGGNAVVTPASPLAGGTTITFNDAGDYVILIWDGSAWAVIENSGTTIA